MLLTLTDKQVATIRAALERNRAVLKRERKAYWRDAELGRVDDCLVALQQQQGAWEPVDHCIDDSGDELTVDNIALTIASGNMALMTFIWPEDGYEYGLFRRLPQEERHE